MYKISVHGAVTVPELNKDGEVIRLRVTDFKEVNVGKIEKKKEIENQRNEHDRILSEADEPLKF